MNQSIGFLIAFLAGVLSFLSPCILPLIPSYLSFIGGISFRELHEKNISKSNIFLRTLLFVAGFSLVFIALGVLFSSTGGLLSQASQIVNIVAGLLIIILGFNFIFDFWKILNIERRFHINQKRSGVMAAFLLGMAFGGGWTPCVGPILASILFLAGTSGKLLYGILLLTVYSMGLGLPFLTAGLFFSQFLKQTEKIKPHLNTIRILSGIFLVIIGLFILLGRLQRTNIFLFTLANNLEAWQKSNPRQPQLLFGFLFFLPVLFLGYSYGKKLRLKANHLFLPIRFIFILLFLLLSILTFVGLINPAGFFKSWFTFQGI